MGPRPDNHQGDEGKTPWQLAQEAQQGYASPKKSKEAKKVKTGPTKKGTWSPSKVYLQGILLVLLCWSFYFLSPFSRPKEILLVGNHQVDAQWIQTQDGIWQGQSMFSILANQKSLEKRLKNSQPHVEALDIHFSGWRQLTLTLRENPSLFYWEEEGKRMELLADKRVIEAKEGTGGIPQLLSQASAEQKEALGRELDKVFPSLLGQIKTISFTGGDQNPQRVELYMQDGLRVVASTHDLGDKLAYYPQISSQLPSNLGTLDLEVGIFYDPQVSQP